MISVKCPKLSWDYSLASSSSCLLPDVLLRLPSSQINDNFIFLVAQVKRLSANLTPLSHIPNHSANPDGSTFKIYPDINLFSPPPLFPAWLKAPLLLPQWFQSPLNWFPCFHPFLPLVFPTLQPKCFHVRSCLSCSQNLPMTFNLQQSKSQVLTIPASSLFLLHFLFLSWSFFSSYYLAGAAPPSTLTLQPLCFPPDICITSSWVSFKSWYKWHLLSEASCSKLSKIAPTPSTPPFFF